MKRKNPVYEQVWIENGEDSDLYEDDYSDLEYSYIDMQTVLKYFGEIICYQEKDDSKQVLFREPPQPQKGSQKTKGG